MERRLYPWAASLLSSQDVPGIRSRPWRPWPALSAESSRGEEADLANIQASCIITRSGGTPRAQQAHRFRRGLFFFSRSFSLPRARVCSVVSADADLLTTGRIFSAQCRPRPHAAVMREVERAGCSRAVWRCWRAAGRGSPIDADLRYMHDALHRPCTL